MPIYFLTATDKYGKRETHRTEAENSQKVYYEYESNGFTDFVLHDDVRNQEQELEDRCLWAFIDSLIKLSGTSPCFRTLPVPESAPSRGSKAGEGWVHKEYAHP